MALETYKKKRNFQITSEPKPKVARSKRGPLFVIQQHAATRLHWDFRLEFDGVLKSWAVTKEPVMDPSIKRLAVQTEDHPLEYATFHGDIPEGQYGAGHVDIWDTGRYDAIGDLREGLEKGKIEFELDGRKLTGKFVMIRARFGKGKDNWLLIKMKERAGGRRSGGRTRTSVGAGGVGGGKNAGAGEEKQGKKTARVTPAGPPQKIPYTNVTKLMFPAAAPTGHGKGILKRDILEYYEQIANVMLPHLRDRPVTLERFPDGLSKPTAPHFWQKNTPNHYPNWIPRARLPAENRKGERSMVDYVLVSNLETLMYLVNQGGLTFHIFLSRLSELDHPDFVLFDVDPHQSTFAQALRVSRAIHDVLQSANTTSFIKTTGKSGLHILVPWQKPGGYDDARAWAMTVAQDVVRDMPDVATTERNIKARGKRVYIDVIQNAMGHHAVAPYTLRATERATVSTPLQWTEVQTGLDPRDFTMGEVIKRVKRMGDLMEGL